MAAQILMWVGTALAMASGAWHVLLAVWYFNVNIPWIEFQGKPLGDANRGALERQHPIMKTMLLVLGLISLFCCIAPVLMLIGAIFKKRFFAVFAAVLFIFTSILMFIEVSLVAVVSIAVDQFPTMKVVVWRHICGGLDFALMIFCTVVCFYYASAIKAELKAKREQQQQQFGPQYGAVEQIQPQFGQMNAVGTIPQPCQETAVTMHTPDTSVTITDNAVVVTDNNLTSATSVF